MIEEYMRPVEIEATPLSGKESEQMSEREIAILIEEKSKEIAKALFKGKSVEINRVNGNTIKFSKIDKKSI